MPDVFGKGQANKKKEGVSEQHLFLAIGQVGSVWDVYVDDLLEFLSYIEEAGPFLVCDGFQALFEAILGVQLLVVFGYFIFDFHFLVILLGLSHYCLGFLLLCNFLKKPHCLTFSSFSHLNGFP